VNPTILLRRRQQEDAELSEFFTDMEEPRRTFEALVTATGPLRKRILSVEAPPSAGKSALLQMFRLFCTTNKVPAALARGEEAKTPIGVLRALAFELQLDGVSLPGTGSLIDRYLTVAKRASQAPAQRESSSGSDSAGSAESAAASRPAEKFRQAMVDGLSLLSVSQEDIELYLDGAPRIGEEFRNDLEGSSLPRIVLMIDTRDKLSGDETGRWLCEFLRYLPPSVLVVVAGLQGLQVDQHWFQLWPQWAASVQTLRLEPLKQTDQILMIERLCTTLGRPVTGDEAQVQRIALWSRGNPTRILVGVTKWLTVGGQDFDDILPDVVQSVGDVLLADLPHGQRAVVEAAAILRTLDPGALGALVEPQAVARYLPVITSSMLVQRKGGRWSLPEYLRSTVTERLRVVDERQYRDLHAKAADYYQAKRKAPDSSRSSSLEQRQGWQLEQLYHEMQRDSAAGFEVFGDFFEEAFFAQRQFDFCRTMIAEVRSQSLGAAALHRIRFYEALISIYCENEPSISRRILEELTQIPDLDPQLEADALEYLAAICWYYNYQEPGEANRARDLYDRCLAIRKSRRDLLGQARVLIWLGILMQRTAGQGEDYFIEARRISATMMDRPEAVEIRARAEQELSITYRMRGDFEKAGPLIDSSAAAFTSLQMPFDEAGARLNSAVLLIWSGRLREAERQLDIVDNLYGRSTITRVQEKAWHRVGLGDVALHRGDVDAAYDLFQQVKSLGERPPNLFIQSLGLGGISSCHLSWRHWAEAIQSCETCLALQESTKDSFGSGWTLGMMALALLRSGDTGGAESKFETGLQIMRDYGSSFGEAKLLLGLCECYLAQRRVDDFNIAAGALRSLAAGRFYDYLAMLALLQARADLDGGASGDVITKSLSEALALGLRHNIFALDCVAAGIVEMISPVADERRREILSGIVAFWDGIPVEGERYSQREHRERVAEDAVGNHQATFIQQMTRSFPADTALGLKLARARLLAAGKPAMIPSAKPKYDVFIIHAGPDIAAAERLFDLLSKNCQVYLDSKRLQPGDVWDDRLDAALEASAVLVVLVSRNVDAAYYAKEEIARGIQAFRNKGKRVIPVYLGGQPGIDIREPYGLTRVHALTGTEADLEEISNRILPLLNA